MKLELRKAIGGTHFMICVCGATKEIVIPLSPALSGELQQMVDAEGIRAGNLILPPGRAHQKLAG